MLRKGTVAAEAEDGDRGDLTAWGRPAWSPLITGEQMCANAAGPPDPVGWMHEAVSGYGLPPPAVPSGDEAPARAAANAMGGLGALPSHLAPAGGVRKNELRAVEQEADVSIRWLRSQSQPAILERGVCISQSPLPWARAQSVTPRHT